MSSSIQPAAPFIQYGRGQPPFVPQLSVGGNIAPLVPYIMTDLMNAITYNAQRSTLRMAIFNACTENNWNNQFFLQHLLSTVRWVERRALETHMNFESVIGECIDSINLLLVGHVYQLYSAHLPLSQDERMQAESLIPKYNQMQQLLSQPLQMAMTPATPGIGSGTTPAWLNNAISRNNTSTLTSTAPAPANPTPAMHSTTGWKKDFPEVREEEPVVMPAVAQATVQAVETEVELEPHEQYYWVGDAEHPYPVAYNPRTHQRRVYRNVRTGLMREEFIHMDYDTHALNMPLTHAVFEATRREMEQEEARPISIDEAKTRIARYEPDQRELAPVKLQPVVGHGSGWENMTWFVQASVNNQPKETDETTGMPFIYETQAFPYLNLITAYSDADNGIVKNFYAALASAKSYHDLRQALCKYADYSIAAAWNEVNDLITREINFILRLQCGIQDLTIDDFHEDWTDLLSILDEEYGDTVAGRLTARRNYRMDRLFSVLAEDTLKDVYSYRNWGDDSEAAFQHFHVLARKSNVTYINYFAFDLEFQVGVGKYVSVPFRTSPKMRCLAEELLDSDFADDVYDQYVLTRDGVLLRIFRGMIDEGTIVYYRVK